MKRVYGRIWHNLFYNFFTKISNNCVKQKVFAQFISSTAYQNKLKIENKHRLFFNSFSDKLLFQPAATLPNRIYIGNL
jgi:hypothetical protein